MPDPLLVILAAGAGSRFVGPTHKLLAPFRGSTVVRHAVAGAVRADVGPVVVVAGEVDLDLGGLPVTVRRNDRWAEGQATSLQVALAVAEDCGADSVVIGLGDQPLVSPEAWRLVAHAEGGPIVAARASHSADLRPPVRLDRDVWPLLPTSGDEGARIVMRENPDLVTIVEVPGDPIDIDTTDDLARWS